MGQSRVHNVFNEIAIFPLYCEVFVVLSVEVTIFFHQ